MSREELIKAHQAAELHDRHLQNAMIAARQRNNAMGMASPGDIPYGGPSNRRSPVRLTSGLSRSARHDEGLEGV